MTAEGLKESQCQSSGKELSSASPPTTDIVETATNHPDELRREQVHLSGFQLLSRPEPVRTHASSSSCTGSSTADSSLSVLEESKVAPKQAGSTSTPLDCCKNRCDAANPSINLHEFIVSTLKRGKDRLWLFQLEEQLLTFLKNSEQQALQFPPMSSYHRMLVHRVAAYFGLEHNVDSSNCVVVTKTSHASVPAQRFREYVEQVNDSDTPKVILRRSQSASPLPSEQVNSSGEAQVRTKTVEEREAEYEITRARIFSQPDLVPSPKQRNAKENSECSGTRQSNRRKKNDAQRQQPTSNSRRCPPPRLQAKSRSLPTSSSSTVGPQSLLKIPIPGQQMPTVNGAWSSACGPWAVAHGGGTYIAAVAPGSAGGDHSKTASPVSSTQLSSHMAGLSLDSEGGKVQLNLPASQPSQGVPLSTTAGIAITPVSLPATSYLGNIAWHQAAAEQNVVSTSMPSATMAWSPSNASDCYPAPPQKAYISGLPPSLSTANACLPVLPGQYPTIVMEVFDLAKNGDWASHLKELTRIGAVLRSVQGRILASFHTVASAQHAFKSNSPNYKLRLLQPWCQPSPAQ